MSIKIIVCDDLATLVAARTDLEAPPAKAVVLYQTAGSQGETGKVRLQSAGLAQNGDLFYEAATTASSYAGKFILVLKV